MAAERRTQKSLEGNNNSRDPSLPIHPVVYNAHTAYHAIRRSLQAPSVHDFVVCPHFIRKTLVSLYDILALLTFVGQCID